jgi:hypothetical protein
MAILLVYGMHVKSERKIIAADVEIVSDYILDPSPWLREAH